MEKYQLIAKTYAGFEDILAQEIRSIGGNNIRTGIRSVSYTGDKNILYYSNYHLRTALRILKKIAEFRFSNVDDFYNKCWEISWDNYLDINQRFAIFSTVIQSREFRNSMFASLKVKDALVDKFRVTKGSRPNVDTTFPDVVFNVHISRNLCTISLDSSGESLHKRGYRVAQGDAPLSEVLAAGMIMLTGWNGESDFIDPMCGSGTLPVEAALIATNTPPGSFRKKFSFQNWMDFDPVLYDEIQKSKQRKFFSYRIHASDLHAKNIHLTRKNAVSAGVKDEIRFEISDFKDLDIQAKGATIVINPPYGERLKQNYLEGLYTMIGERLKHKYPGNNAWILSASKKYFHKIGLKPSFKTVLYNSQLQCSYQKYELFEGKRVP